MCSRSARILRHLALGSNPLHKSEALIAVEPLVAAIKVRGLPTVHDNCICMPECVHAEEKHRCFRALRGAVPPLPSRLCASSVSTLCGHFWVLSFTSLRQ